MLVTFHRNLIVKKQKNKREFSLFWMYNYIPGMLGVLYHFLTVLSPLVSIIQYIHIAHGLEAKPRFPYLSSWFYPSHFHCRNAKMIIYTSFLASQTVVYLSPCPKIISKKAPISFTKIQGDISAWKTNLFCFLGNWN